jgi:uncharacterized membrane protein
VLGGIGAILLLVSGIVAFLNPFFPIIFAIAGLALLTMTYRKISNKFNDETIFRHILIFLGCLITSVVIGFATAIFATQFFTLNLATILTGGIQTLIGVVAIALGLLILQFALQVVGSYFFYKANKATATHTGISLFRTASLLVFIGAILTIILIGALITLIGWILLIIAFFTTKTEI